MAWITRRRLASLGGWWIGVVLVVVGQSITFADDAAPNKPDRVTDTCADQRCHGDIIASQFLHGPAAQNKCDPCHQYDEPREHRFRLTAEPDQLCATCHTLQHRTNVHTPVATGNCTGCHDPHGSNFRFMMLDDPTQGLCVRCHAQDFAGKPVVHGPVDAGACILCHDAHSSWEPKLLVKAPNELCRGCHSELIPSDTEQRHVHQPVVDGRCTDCHDPHASQTHQLLRAPAKQLCLACHEAVGEQLAHAAFVHGAIDEQTGCGGCHRPHFSALAKLQRQTQPAACLECHNRPIETADGQTLTDMASLLGANPDHHGPIREGECTACHQPHAADHFRLLTKAYPKGFYAPFSLERYELCFTCHITDLVTSQSGVGLTRFRNGDVNLHWLHVNQDKGRTCRACHEVHASKRPAHVRDAVPFGDSGWMLQINFEQTETGGSCEPGCHRQRTYQHAANESGGSP